MSQYLCIALLTVVFTLNSVKVSQGIEQGYAYLWGGFSTSLVGRSAAQMHNADFAAAVLDGTVIPPGCIFSFNDLVGSRDRGNGYIPAPIINGLGTLQDIPGGGICQLASTIYNAGLYAGMEIVERHPHSRAVSYVPPGRDATIATWRKDLKLRNPHRTSLILRISMKNRRMTASFWSTADKGFKVEIKTDSIPLEPAIAVDTVNATVLPMEQTGGYGFSVITRRSYLKDDLIHDQELSVDYYPPPTRILKGGSR
ncbi:MAG: VanW family protein [Geobacteraceae bacterium]|nr:VanW family protein [Geobacteraceae bacterium]